MSRGFWSGFGTGVGVAFAGMWAFGLAGRGTNSRVVRLEKSVQIGRPVRDVFEAWRNIEHIPEYTRLIRSVEVSGNRSRWVADVVGREVTWDAVITQIIPDQVIGWKTLGGARHTGRVVFSPVEGDTVVHVQMNYMPPSRALRPMVANFAGELEGYIEQALRDFKAALENPESAARIASETRRATGTYGPELAASPLKENTRYGPPHTPVEYTRPPEPDYMNKGKNK